MSEQSPIIPSDLAPLSSSLLACDALRSLLQTRTDMQEFLQWLLANDSSGDLGSDFKLAIRNQLLFDAAKKGWVAMSNDSTGALELREFLPLASLAVVNSVEGDTLSFEGGVWITKSAPSIYLAPTTGGVTLPDAAVGATCQVAHGLGVEPRQFSCVLECSAADANYAIGDRVDASTLMSRNGADTEIAHGASVFANATLVGVVFRTAAGAAKYQLSNKSTFTRADLVSASWNVKMFAQV